MRTVFYDYSLYNEPVKLEFLSQYKREGTIRAMKRIMHHSLSMEKRLNKDLGSFTNEEIDYFIRRILQPTSVLSAKSNCNVLSLYLKFAQEKNMRTDNPLDVNSNEYAKYATENETDLISFSDMNDITMTVLANANDALIIRLIFEGALGFELSEVANLKESDVDFDNSIITLHDDSEKKEVKERTLKVNRGTMELIRSAIKETVYKKQNGEMDDSNPRIKTEIELLESEYVLRPSTNRTSIGGNSPLKCSRATLYSRIRVVREVDALKSVQAKWNTKQIQRSGMLWQALKIVQKKGKLERKDYRVIAERFGIPFNWHDRNVINIETIEKVYGKDYMNIDTDFFENSI
jgi:integrase